MSTSLLVSDEGPVRILTLNRPRQLNALDGELRHSIVGALGDAKDDDAVRAVMITGAGDRGFCSGQDLNESVELEASEGHEWQGGWQDYILGFLNFPKPLVAAINGVAAGGGFVTALLCDIRLAVPGARLIMIEINIGLPCMLGSFLLAQELFWSRAVEMVLRGRDIEAREAKRMGIVHDIVEPDGLAARGLSLARELAAKPPNAMRLTIQRFRHLRRRAMEENKVFEALEAYQGEAIASGEPQRVMAEFLSARAARKN
jgi:enoyl-CoA hydratase/carnithine racemase